MRNSCRVRPHTCERPYLKVTVSKLVCNPDELVARLPEGLTELSCCEQIRDSHPKPVSTEVKNSHVPEHG